MTLNERSLLRSYSSVMTHAFLHAAVAPTRRLRHPSSDFIEIAKRLAQRLDLPAVPHMASASTHTFVEPDEDGSHAPSLTVKASGLVEMLWALKQLPTPDEAWALDALEPCTQLARFAMLVSSDDYEKVLGKSWLARRLQTRVDWTLGITMTSICNGGGRGWRDIIVPNHKLDRATGHEFGFMPPLGYGASRLRNAQRAESPNTIVATLLEEWLQANGYFHIEEAVTNTVRTAVALSLDAD